MEKQWKLGIISGAHSHESTWFNQGNMVTVLLLVLVTVSHVLAFVSHSSHRAFGRQSLLVKATTMDFDLKNYLGTKIATVEKALDESLTATHPNVEKVI